MSCNSATKLRCNLSDPCRFSSNIFFFKQKTAYEMDGCLEFRRVLFRSPRRRSRPEGRGRSPAATSAGSSQRSPHGSEERRVGKECRSRWWRYHKKKKIRKNKNYEGRCSKSNQRQFRVFSIYLE